MCYVNLATAVDQVITTFIRNRTGKKPLVFTAIPAEIACVAWSDGKLEDLVRVFLFHCLSTSNPNTTIEITVKKHGQLRGLENFVGVHPSYWTKLRASGRDLKMLDRSREELFQSMGYRCEEWVGMQASGTRLGIFAAADMPELKLVFCAERRRTLVICDLLLPISEMDAVSNGPNHEDKNVTP